MNTDKHTEIKVYNMQDKLFGLTFKTTFKHLDNHYHYEIFVRVPDDHNEEDKTYEDIEGFRTTKIASVGGFQTQGYAFAAMTTRIGELLEQVQR
jgi:hypothetical protein